MARTGIYVNGKEIVARYFGDRLVWKKNKEITILSSGRYRISGEWNRTAYCWCYITKEMSQKYPANELQNGLKILLYSTDSPQPIAIENVTGGHYYTNLTMNEEGLDKRFWNKCHLQLEFQNMEDLATLKRLTYDTKVLFIELVKRG